MNHYRWQRRSVLIVFLLLVLVSGCAPPASATPSDRETPTSVVTPHPAPSAAPLAPGIWLAPHLPPDFSAAIEPPPGWTINPNPEDAAMKIDLHAGDMVLATWIYALVAPFPTITDGIKSHELISLWRTGTVSDAPVQRLLVSQNTHDLLAQVWGNPASQTVTAVPQDRLRSLAWDQQATWAIVPFDELHPEWKVIEIDGISPVRKDFSTQNYPLAIPITASGEAAHLEMLADRYAPGSPQAFAPQSNRDPEQLTTVILTGVTALVRATAYLMHLHGMTYPGEDIRHWLREADFTHINNEVPFTPRCPQPFTRPNEELIFCSQPQYIKLLEDIGTNIIELSGDHLDDWGREAMLFTLDYYHERGWDVYGGGANLEEARRPLLIEHNGNRLAFLGCNAKAAGYARASETYPGTWFCNMEWLQTEISRLRAEGYLPIITYQHHEVYIYGISPVMQPDFQAAAKAGAVIVSGSQAHQPHAMEFYQGTFIHYGLGNLFFDQYNEGFPMRQAFIDRHVFYQNRHISTELLTVLLIDFARPRPMTEEERQELLEVIFEASGW